MAGKPKKVQNFRDLGGIPCADGIHRVSFGKLFRSGHAGKVHPKNIRELRDTFGIVSIADLRTAQEILEKPDIIADEIAYEHLPTLTNEQNPTINKKTRLAVLKRYSALPDGARGYLMDTYRMLVDQPIAVDAYRRILNLMAEKPAGGLLWHCTQGKDRTGMTTAIVLMALGVSREEIMRDYMQKELLHKLQNVGIFILITLLMGSVKMAKSLNCCMTAKKEFLQAAFEKIDSLYGGDEGYLRDCLGIDPEQQALLRETYCEVI